MAVAISVLRGGTAKGLAEQVQDKVALLALLQKRWGASPTLILAGHSIGKAALPAAGAAGGQKTAAARLVGLGCSGAYICTQLMAALPSRRVAAGHMLFPTVFHIGAVAPRWVTAPLPRTCRAHDAAMCPRCGGCRDHAARETALPAAGIWAKCLCRVCRAPATLTPDAAAAHCGLYAGQRTYATKALGIGAYQPFTPPPQR
jgi:hypothetical protein